MKSVQINELGSLATILVIVAITISIGALILTNVANTDTFIAGDNSSAVAGIDAVGVFADWLTIIAIVIVAVVVLGLIKFL